MYYAFFVAILIAGIFASCDSKAKKVENAQENLQDSKEELKEAQRELNEEYPLFRIEADKLIAANGSPSKNLLYFPFKCVIIPIKLANTSIVSSAFF
ncbi:MAG: hypothetical protein CVT92_15795, partial [Bacteroidetes bacterium HGW-Bacteroidetes-1]